MAQGYLVSLGNGQLNSGDSIIGPMTGFNIQSTLGTGQWTWTGVWQGDGQTYSNITDTGTYYLATDGNIYFTPTNWYVDNLSAGTATAAPTYDDGIYGTAADNTLNGDSTNEAIYGGAGTGETGTGADTINAGAGNDTITSGDGNDVVQGGGNNDILFGGTGDDRLYGDTQSTLTASTENLSWIGQGASGTNIFGGFTQDTGGMRVTANFNNDGSNTGVTTSNSGQYVGGGPYSANSSVQLTGNGGANVTASLVFNAEAGSGLSNQVSNVNFIINDVDMAGWRDIITVNAWDANGNPVAVTLSPYGNDTVSGNTITAANTSDTQTSANGAVQVTIAGPVHFVEIVYSNAGTVGQALWITDVYFTTIVPTDGDDTITGGAGNDSIYGGGGNDSLIGGADNDVIYGGTGNDMLDGGDGTDVLYGDAGNDVIYYGAGNDTVYGGAGDDVIDDIGGTGFVANDLLFGDAGNDTIWAGGGTDTVYGGADNDFLNGEDGNDSVYGDAGADNVYGGAGDDALFGGSGNDSLYGQDNNDTLYGGSNDDLIYAGNGDDVIGNWSIDDSGNDTMFGEAGNDSIVAGGGNDTVYGGTGNDTLSGQMGADTLYGEDDQDVFLITEDHESDVIFGGEGGTDFDVLNLSTYLSTNGVNVTFTGTEAGNYSYVGQPGNGTFAQIEGVVTTGFADTINAAASTGPITLSAEAGDDTIIGGSGDDLIYGGTGADQITGGAGNDSIDVGIDGDADTIVLADGSGQDTIRNLAAPTANGDGTFTGTDQLDVTGLTNGTRPVNVNDVVVTDDGSGHAVLTFPNGESVTLIGITPANATNPFYLNALGIPLSDGTVEGTAGNDIIDAGYLGDPDGDLVDDDDAILPGDTGNDDLIYGYGGNDSVYSGAGNDEIYGGDGNDVLQSVSGDNTIYGDAGNDQIYAGGGNDIAYGGTGNDTLNASIGNDTYYGGDDSDSLIGGSGDDLLSGDAGNDTLDGGIGNDSMSGGDGSDLFVFKTGFGTDTLAGGEGGVDHDANDLGALTTGVDVVFTGNEAGSLTDGTGTASFTEIEQLNLTAYDDTADASADSSGTTILAGDGQDTLVGGSGNDSLFGEAGNDSVTGGAGNDYIDGETGNDTLSGGQGDDILVGDDGTDTLSGGDGADQLYAGADNDTLDGGAGNDLIYGGTGSDTIMIGDNHGTDTVLGGEDVGGGDNDILDLYENGSAQGVTVTYTGSEAGTYDFNGTTSGGTFAEIETLDATNFADTVDASAATSSVTILGNDGNDVITGGTGADTLSGGADADTFYVQDGFGNDTVVGGQTGNNYDTLDLSGLTNPVSVVFTGPGAGTITDMVTGDVITFSEIEQLILTNQADLVDATNDDGYTYVQTLGGDDTYTGSSGDDVVDDQAGTGPGLDGQGNDTFYGGAGNDLIWAGDDDDAFFGGSGADTLNGQAGNDTITFAEGDGAYGGDGDDLFILQDLGEATNGTITIEGGNNVQTTGDTLQLGSLAQWNTLNITSTGPNGQAGTITLDDGTILNFSEIENIICFTPGTLIATPRGARAIETLRVGDLVVTRDHGLQPIRWIRSRTVPALDRFAPVRIRPGVVPGLDRDLLVSPQHRMLFNGYRAELLFGESEVLVAARHLIDGVQVTQEFGGAVTYIHMLFDEHEIVYADGAATESFHPGDLALTAISDDAREELFALFPELRISGSGYGRTARRCLKSHETAILLS